LSVIDEEFCYVLRFLVKLSFLSLSLLILSPDLSVASKPTYPDEDVHYSSRLQIRNYSATLTYVVALEHPVRGEQMVFIAPKTEKRIEHFFPHESFRDRPHYYGFQIGCEKDGTFYKHSRNQVELFTLIALFDPKHFNVDHDCSYFTNLRLGTSSFLLPETMKVNHFNAYNELSKVEGMFPYYKINFNPVSLSQSKSLAPALKTWLDDKRLRLEVKLDIPDRQNLGQSTENLAGSVKTLGCIHYGLITNGYVRDEQLQTYLRTLTEQAAIEDIPNRGK